jgi:ABC-type transport system involved in multi-copper enzyme maturation permease subunit
LAKLVSGGATLLGVIALVLYAMSFASEYSQGTIRNLLVREPHRLRLLFGKLAGTALFVSTGVVGAAAASIAVAYIVAPGQSISTSAWSFGAVGGAFGRVLLTTLGWGVLGTVLALVLRAPAPAIGTGVVYILLVDPIINAAWSTGGRWLPGQLLQTVAQGGTAAISLTRASLLVGIYTAGILFAGAALFVRREVTT